MSPSQALVLIDHHSAHIQPLLDVSDQIVREHRSHTRQHGSAVRTEHDFFSDVCLALEAFGEVLVLGGHAAQADFRRYVEKHRPALAKHLVGWETVDAPTPAQALATARAFFEHFNRMAGRKHA